MKWASEQLKGEAMLDSFKQRFYFNREISSLIGNQSSESPEDKKGGF
jgi:hypothetical protein